MPRLPVSRGIIYPVYDSLARNYITCLPQSRAELYILLGQGRQKIYPFQRHIPVKAI